MSRAVTGVVLALTTGVLVSTPLRPGAAEPTLPPGFQLVSYPTGQAPYDLTDFAWLPDGGLLTSGKDGTVTYVPPGGSPRTIAQVPGVRVTGDHGMLGFAPANDYASTGHVYISYDKGDPATSGDGMVEEWTASPPSAPTSFTRTATVLDGATMTPPLEETGSTHSIDSVVVAPDGSLFLSIGDNARNNGDPRTFRAQDLDQPYGKLLHLNPDGTGVRSNPFYSAGAPRSWRSLVYAYGFRNPFRFDLDPRSGIPHLGDVGWTTTEEVDTVRPGMNAGWPCYEGAEQNAYFASDRRCTALYAAGTAVPPITEYQHDGAGAAVVGGMHYTGDSYPAEYSSSFFYGDYARGEIWTLATDDQGHLTRGPEPNGFAQGVGGPVAFHPGPNGDVTYADLVGGTVERLVYSAGDRAPTADFTSTTDPDTDTVTFDASSSYDLDGDPMTYTWDFGDGSPTATGESVQHTYAEDDEASTVTLTVSDPLGATGTATRTVHPGNHTPVLSLSAPPPGTVYAVGDPVRLSASATDQEDGDLPVSWFTYLLHCPFAGSCHVHPEDTVTGPTYDEPFTDHGSDTIMVITARATDEDGDTAQATYEALPALQTVSVTSPVAVAINGETSASQQVVEGSQVELSAPATSGILAFDGWSDGGAAQHAFTMPAHDVALTARYSSPIDRKVAALGRGASALGKALGPEYDVSGGRARDYAHGRMYWSAASGAHPVLEHVLATYDAVGGLAAAGFPMSDLLRVHGGQEQSFSVGRIYSGASAGTRWVTGAVLAKYLALGGPRSSGLPRVGLRSLDGGSYQLFTGDRGIFWSRATHAHLVRSAILARYRALGYATSCLGFPTTDQYAVRGGLRNRFAHGSLTYERRSRSVRSTC